MSGNALLEATADVNEYEFEVTPLFCAIFGREFQCSSTTKGLKMQGWGNDAQRVVVPVGKRKFTFNPHRHEGKAGLKIQVEEPDGAKRSIWWSWAELEMVTVLFRGGVELT